jgi:hypothetical protein
VDFDEDGVGRMASALLLMHERKCMLGDVRCKKRLFSKENVL